jgi:FKBP-type peptidyl-prolyl cis-trans isomerase
MDRNKWIILAVLIFLVGALALSKQSEKPATTAPTEHFEGDGHDHGPDDGHDHSADENAATPAANAAGSTPDATAPKEDDVKELKKTDLKVGGGKTAKAGDKVTVNYRGSLTNGTVFDESYKRGQPFTFTLGGGEVIQGWDEGVAGMKEGGKRKLVIPGDLAYGPNPPPGAPIPPNATLVFEVELLKVG